MGDATVVLEFCPGCGVAYEIPAAEIFEAGRRVRCVRCAETWLVLPEDAAPPTPESVHTPVDDGHVTPERPDNPVRFWLVWLAVVVLAGVVGAFLFREPLAREFPAVGAALERYAAWVSMLF